MYLLFRNFSSQGDVRRSNNTSDAHHRVKSIYNINIDYEEGYSASDSDYINPNMNKKSLNLEDNHYDYRHHDNRNMRNEQVIKPSNYPHKSNSPIRNITSLGSLSLSDSH